jgi:hypothetical protein
MPTATAIVVEVVIVVAVAEMVAEGESVGLWRLREGCGLFRDCDRRRRLVNGGAGAAATTSWTCRRPLQAEHRRFEDGFNRVHWEHAHCCCEATVMNDAFVDTTTDKFVGY